MGAPARFLLKYPKSSSTGAWHLFWFNDLIQFAVRTVVVATRMPGPLYDKIGVMHHFLKCPPKLDSVRYEEKD
jgi:hypothetical protein